MIAAELLARIPDDDPTYLAALAHCQSAGMHPAVAAVQAHVDLNHRTRRTKGRYPMAANRKPIRHGTNAGYQTHLRRGIEPCDDCLAAHRVYQHGPTAPPAGRPCSTCGQPRLPKHFGRVEPAVRVRLECECGHIVDSVDRLITHTLTVHGRGPTRTERTPRTHRKDVA